MDYLVFGLMLMSYAFMWLAGFTSGKASEIKRFRKSFQDDVNSYENLMRFPTVESIVKDMQAYERQTEEKSETRETSKTCQVLIEHEKD